MNVDMEVNSLSDMLGAAFPNPSVHAPSSFQYAAIQSILSGKDTVVIAHAGAGK